MKRFTLKKYTQEIKYCKYVENCADSIVESRKEKSRDVRGGLKSRDAARHRRGQENSEFTELSKLLPLPHDITGQL